MLYKDLKALSLNPNLESLIIGCFSYDNSFEFHRGLQNGYYHFYFKDFVPGVVLSFLCSKVSQVLNVSYYDGVFDVKLVFYPEL